MKSLDFLSEYREGEREVNIKQATWYIVAASSLAAAGAGSDVPDLYRLAVAGLSVEDEKIVQRRIKEAILKTSILHGFPKALQALLPLFSIIKDDAIDHYAPRTEALLTGSERQTSEERGRHYFDTTWTPAAAESTRLHLQKYQQDLYLLTVKMGYDHWVSEDAILSNVETQMCNVGALVCSRSPVQATWHTRGILRHGGTVDQARMAQGIALNIANNYGCKTDDITVVDDIDFNDTTFP